MTPDSLIRELNVLGFHARVVSARRLEDLGRALEKQHCLGLFDEDFFQERLTGFASAAPKTLPAAESLVVLAYADPHVRFIFEWMGKRISATVPSTYLQFRERDASVRKALEGLLAEDGYSAAEARVPKKLLAARSGLSRYGRNNVTYIGVLGSYYRLTAFFSDLPCDSDEWAEPRVLERCEKCTVCTKACPTGAIDPERFLLHAERCITFWNEKPKGVPFPDWLDPTWHNCIVGCLHCQRVCPENRDVSDFCEHGEEFSEAETGILLEGRQAGELPVGLVAKLERADLLPALDTLPRNLGALLAKRNP
jgi:epoxyqueuosine reductase